MSVTLPTTAEWAWNLLLLFFLIVLIKRFMVTVMGFVDQPEANVVVVY
jgi:hypothetical protein